MAAQKPEINVVVKDKYTAAAISNYTIRSDAETIYFDGKEQNFDLRISEIEKHIGKTTYHLVKDLYRIAAAVYISDIRMEKTEKQRSRAINILITVSDIGKWVAQKQRLESLIHFLSGDHVVFHFVQGEPPKGTFVFKPIEKKSVCLFSGGLDSLAGIKWLKDQGIRPVMISHCANNKICHIQSELAGLLKNLLADNLDFFQISARGKSGKELNMREYSQATRSFLFLSIACVFAVGLGIPVIHIFENGIMGLNIPIVQSRIFNNTKTVHPSLLAKYNQLINFLFPNCIRVENPFILMTKGEVLQSLNTDGFRDILRDSVSCAKMQGLRWEGTTLKHCGTCVPCVLRRVSIHHANLDAYDDQYEKNIFGDFNALTQEGKSVLLQTLDFGRKLKKDDVTVMNEIPHFYIPEMEDQALAIGTTRRYIQEVKNAIKDIGTESMRTTLAERLDNI